MSGLPENIPYDAVMVFGAKPMGETPKFPSHIYAALEKSAELYRLGKTRYIILSGNYALRYDRDNKRPPFRECDAMADYLIAQGIPRDVLLLEDTSKDTVANFYYTKREVLTPHSLHKLHCIAADFRIARLDYLAQKIFGPDYTVTFTPVAALTDEVNPTESIIMRRTQDFLASMHPGDDSFLKDAFYTHPFYQRPKK
jgi:uncharacterized SAM-binding protein YcdF (DUF218 family)